MDTEGRRYTKERPMILGMLVKEGGTGGVYVLRPAMIGDSWQMNNEFRDCGMF
jgi:hypothetical protein